MATTPTAVPQQQLACRNDGCDQSYGTPQGRALHERRHCEHRQDATA